MEENKNNNEPLNKDFKEPKLRFHKFNSCWKKDKLSELVSCYKGGSLSKEDINDSGNIYCILYGELYTSYLNKIEAINSKTFLKENLVLAKKGDVILPLSGETPLDISNSAVVPFDGVALGGDLLGLRTKLNSLFLSYEISGKRKRQIAKLAQGKTIVHSNPKSLLNIVIYYPSNDEQDEIAAILDLLSRKISILVRKIDTLKKYKKGIQNKFFKSIKIKGYKKLKDVAIFMPKSKLSAGQSIKDGKYPFYLSGEKIGKLDYFCLDGCYIIANDGGEANFRITRGKFSYSNHCLCFKTKCSETTKLLCEFLESIKNKITYIGFTGSGLKNIDRNYFLNIKIPQDLFDLENSIIFEFLNTKIDILQSEKKTLNSIKSFLLSNLFI